MTEFESGSETISDGEDVWTLDLVNNAVTGHFSPHSVEVPDCDYGRILQEIVRFYRLELEGTETQSDRLCYVIQAVPEDNSFLPIRTIWIDKEQRTPVKIKSDYGYYQSLIQYENFSHDIGFDDDYFAISLPFRAINGSTSSVMYDLIPFDKAQENVNFSILVPSYTSNYLFVGASLPQNNASDCVTLFYTNGSRSLIITQTVSGVEQPSNTDTSVTLTYGDGEIVEKFGGNVILKVNCNQVEVAIIGQLDKEEIIKIAESLGCA